MAKSESRKKNLQELTRSLAEGDLASASELLRASGGRGAPRRPSRHAEAGPIPLAKACPGREARIRTGRGDVACRLVRRSLAALPAGRAIAREYVHVLRGARQHFDELEASPGLCHVADARPEDLLLLGVDACDEAGGVVYLASTAFLARGDLRCEQYLARDPSEEIAVLGHLCKRWGAAGVLVTFGGTRRKLPLIRRRCEACGVELPWQEPPHLDVRDEARSRWRGQVRSFSLASLERHVLGRCGAGDTPRGAIRQAYQQFLDSGDARGLRGVLRGEAADLLTIAGLVGALLTGCQREQ